ncbi:serine/threonine protein phosphatase PrpC [Enterococcus sp. PF1-24]|uniref:Stp1/IreP family PP2C-type Ser/Thr phosphatase n=1 Tax=unclassified Enterococcus TaxID=2608891 RepID=UPI002476E98F|nr:MULTISPECIES: Stp1/IreP family PP2C-type Ser/Thr phosphatase [unclassified Enterococcus]MDH6364287.1 serine/threonine protein phosphatase PrpC [Enterococcus sp. PFB1-1]MDH6401354.1 serine/threonine protein phosphatase PrpC [Enterococcus sp. PF1-24]
MEIRFQSDVGQRRMINQDYTDVFENQAGIILAILADGMGGHSAGEVASQMVVKALGASWQENQLSEATAIENWMKEQIEEVNTQVYTAGQANPEYQGMGTTVVMVALLPEEMIFANVGDSRGYLLRESLLHQVTEDHSLVNALVQSGEITKEMARTHPRRNVLLRTIGMPGPVRADTFRHRRRPDDYIILCSDGLTNMVTERAIAQIVDSRNTLSEKVNRLVQQANAAGGTDNITVLIIECGGEDQ